MHNTGIKYTAGDITPIVLPAFSELLPPLPYEQYEKLEQDILQNGCYAPIILNEELNIVDGHHRHKICEKHNVPYEMAVFSFEDILEAQQWELETQKARRNLTAWELGQIALKLKPALEEKGKAHMSAGGGDQKSEDAKSGLVNSSNPIPEAVDTRKQLAQTAGIGEQTMGRIIQIDEHAPAPVKEALNTGELSVNQGYNITRELKSLPEDAREQAAQEAVALAKEKKKLKQADAAIGKDAKISKIFCTAFEKANLIEPTEDNIRIWVLCSRMTKAEVKDMADEARELSDVFAQISELLEAQIREWRSTDETQEVDEDALETEDTD